MRVMAQSLVAMISSASADALPAQHGALAALRDTPHALCLFEAEASSPALLGDLRSYLEQHRPHGVIVLPPLSENAELTALCRDMGCNAVRLAPGPLEGPVPVLCSNHRQAAADATNYLIAIGHQRIAFIAGAESCRAAHFI